jgi:hypothetical protein
MDSYQAIFPSPDDIREFSCFRVPVADTVVLKVGPVEVHLRDLETAQALRLVLTDACQLLELREDGTVPGT